MFPKMRRSKQELPLAESLAILEKAPTGVLGVLDGDGYPYTVPLNYVYQDGQIYFHCAKAGHKLESLQRHDKVSFCVVALDEVVPQRFATRYQSVVVFGRARVIADDAVRRIALQALIQKYSPGRAARKSSPPGMMSASSPLPPNKLPERPTGPACRPCSRKKIFYP